MATEFEQLRLSITLIDDASAGLRAVREEMRGTTGSAADYQKLLRDNTKSAAVYKDVVGHVDGRLVLLGGSVGFLSSKLDRIGSSIGSGIPAITAFAKQQQQANQIAQLLGMSIGQLKTIRSQAARSGISQEDADKTAAGLVDLRNKLSSVGGRTRFQEMLHESGFSFNFRAHTELLAAAKDDTELFNLIQEGRRNIERYAIEKEGMDPETAREMGHKWLMLHGLPPTAVAMETLKQATAEYLAEQQRRVDVAEAWLKQTVQLSKNVKSIKGQIVVALGPGTKFYEAVQQAVKVTTWLADNAELTVWSWMLLILGSPVGLALFLRQMQKEGFSKLWDLLRKKLSNEMEELTFGIQKINLVMSPTGPKIVPASFEGGGYSGTQGLPGWLQTPGGGGRLPATGGTPGIGTGGTPGTPSGPATAPTTPGGAPRPAPTSGTGTGGTPGTPSGGGSYGGTRPQAYNYFQKQGVQPSRGDTVVIDTPYGKMTVHKDAASDFQGFYNDLYAGGAPIRKAGSFNMRQKRWGGGWSSHAYGAATDLDDEVQLSPQMKAWIRANPERWARIKAKWNMGQPLTDDDQTGGKDPAHIEWRGPKQGSKPEEKPAAAATEEPAKPAWPRTLSAEEEPAQRYVPNPARMPRMPGESEEAWKARGQRAVERATAPSPGIAPKLPAVPESPALPNLGEGRFRSGARGPIKLPRPSEESADDAITRRIQEMKAESGLSARAPPGSPAREIQLRFPNANEQLDRSALDRASGNELRATVNGGAKVDVDVSASKKSGGESDSPLKPITVERQSAEMHSVERGPSVEVD